jgi:uncharacterized protein
MASAALVDASAIVAAFGERQPKGEHYRGLLRRASEESWTLATTWPCIVEASVLLDVPRRYTMLRWVGAGALSVFTIGPETLDGLVETMVRWTERPRTEMDLADATLVWLAAETGVLRVLTLDTRDFARYRLPDGRAFEIL